MPKIVFSTDDLPAGMDDVARFRLWRDVYTARFGDCEMYYSQDTPFSAHFEFAQFGEICVTRHDVALRRYSRNAAQAAAEPCNFLLGFNRSPSPPTLTQRNRELTVSSGQLALFTHAEPVEGRAAIDMALIGVCVPQARMLERIAQADDLILAPVDATTPAARHLRGYLELLLGSEGIADDPLLLAHAESTLLDLIALALGANGDIAEIAHMRGLRAARLQEILRAIKINYANPTFGVRNVAHRLGVSPRYINNLLHETGRGLTERVLELRLQKARTMLADPRHDRSKIVEIAYDCGFNEVSYFNRCFRRRFGASPTQFRGTTNGE